MIKVGIRAHDVACDTATVVSEQIRNYGFNATHLALRKAILDNQGQPRTLDMELAKDIKSEFADKNLSIAVLGVYLNYVTPDTKALEENYLTYKRHLELAKQMGVTLIGTETGSILPDYGYTELNFKDDAFNQWLKSLEKMVQWSEEADVYLAIEGVAKHIVNTPQRMKQTLDSIGSKHLKVIFDPVNYLTIDNLKDQEAMIYYNFEHYADKIQVIHAKDLLIRDGQILPAVPGTGLLNYEFLMEQVTQCKTIDAITLEDVVGKDIPVAKQFLENFF